MLRERRKVVREKNTWIIQTHAGVSLGLIPPHLKYKYLALLLWVETKVAPPSKMVKKWIFSSFHILNVHMVELLSWTFQVDIMTIGWATDADPTLCSGEKRQENDPRNEKRAVFGPIEAVPSTAEGWKHIVRVKTWWGTQICSQISHFITLRCYNAVLKSGEIFKMLLLSKILLRVIYFF